MKLRKKLITHCVTLGCLTLVLQQLTLGATFDNRLASNIGQPSILSLSNSALENPEELATIDYSKLDVEGILLPRNLFILQGSPNAVESYNIYYKNAVLALLVDYHLSSFSEYGSSLQGRWNFRSGDPNKMAPISPFNLTFNLMQGTTVTTKSTSVEIVNTFNTKPVRLLAIGDSITRAGVYLNQVQKKLPNITNLGTRVYPGETTPREGRGGWTLERYVTGINSAELDSPFVFPVEVAGANYKGNTRDWKKICYTDPKNSIYDGFQKIARGWKDTGDYLYDQNGYYKYPVPGDVMVDPSLPLGMQWVEWNGYIWSPMAIQPTEFEFNFTKYMARFQNAYLQGTPTHISILLGANDFGFNNGLEDLKGYMDKLNAVLDSIHAYDPNIKIILCTPTPAPNADIITDSRKEFYYAYDRKMKIATYYLLKTFDNDESIANNIYIAPMNLTLEANNGFDYKEKMENINGIPTKVITPVNSIHPSNTFGHLRMGETLAAVIQKYR